MAQEGADAGDHAAAHCDLDQGAVERDLEEAPAHPGDGDELHPHDHIGDLQRRLGIADQKKVPPTKVAIPVRAPRTSELPLPLSSPSSESASERPMLIAAPSEAARPTRRAA
jgi:hypothetical protein